MRKRAAIVGLVMLTASACGVKADGPPPIEVDRTPCAHCGMLISEPVFAAAYRAPGAEARVFDDIGCLLASVSRETAPAGVRFWFHDAASLEWIDGTDAAFVKSERLRTPMGGGLLAYRGGPAADRGALQHDGRVVPTLERLLSERGFTRE